MKLQIDLCSNDAWLKWIIKNVLLTMRWVSWSFRGLISFKNHLSYVTQQKPVPEHLFFHAVVPLEVNGSILLPIIQGFIPDSISLEWVFLCSNSGRSYAWRSWAVILSTIQRAKFLSLLGSEQAGVSCLSSLGFASNPEKCIYVKPKYLYGDECYNAGARSLWLKNESGLNFP